LTPSAAMLILAAGVATRRRSRRNAVSIRTGHKEVAMDLVHEMTYHALLRVDRVL